MRPFRHSEGEGVPHAVCPSTERATDGRHRDGSIRDKNVVGFEKRARLNVEKGYNRRGNLPLLILDAGQADAVGAPNAGVMAIRVRSTVEPELHCGS